MDGRASEVARKVSFDVGVLSDVQRVDLVPVDEAANPRGNGEISYGDVVSNNPIVAFKLLVQNSKKTLSLLRVALDGVRDLYVFQLVTMSEHMGSSKLGRDVPSQGHT